MVLNPRLLPATIDPSVLSEIQKPFLSALDKVICIPVNLSLFSFWSLLYDSHSLVFFFFQVKRSDIHHVVSQSCYHHFRRSSKLELGFNHVWDIPFVSLNDIFRVMWNETFLLYVTISWIPSAAIKKFSGSAILTVHFHFVIYPLLSLSLYQI